MPLQLLWRYGGACMVVDFGTAITFTTISETGKILGVAIVPGLQTALKSLTGNTAQLRGCAIGCATLRFGR